LKEALQQSRDDYKEKSAVSNWKTVVPRMEDKLVIVDPNIMMGKPVIAGTRITVELILDKLAAGETIEQILEDYPQLTRESVLAAISFASEAMKATTTHSTSEVVD
jgi:uncharacterized protein (DUF433 family)